MRIVKGDALLTLPHVLQELSADATVCVLTTSAFAYFSAPDRRAFVELLKAASSSRPLVWISAEEPGIVESLEVPAPLDEPAVCLLGAITVHGSLLHPDLLAVVHAHGEWMDWRTGDAVDPDTAAVR